MPITSKTNPNLKIPILIPLNTNHLRTIPKDSNPTPKNWSRVTMSGKAGLK